MRRRTRWTRRRKRATAIAAVFLVLLMIWLSRGDAADEPWTRRELLDAIRFVESGHRDDVPDGDGGLAIGPYQIHRVYWLDAVRAEPGLGGDYQDCRDQAYAERVIAAYMEYWVPEAWARDDAEVVARTHNGGPNGASKASTLGYWEKVRRAR